MRSPSLILRVEEADIIEAAERKLRLALTQHHNWGAADRTEVAAESWRALPVLQLALKLKPIPGKDDERIEGGAMSLATGHAMTKPNSKRIASRFESHRAAGAAARENALVDAHPA